MATHTFTSPELRHLAGQFDRRGAEVAWFAGMLEQRIVVYVRFAPSPVRPVEVRAVLATPDEDEFGHTTLAEYRLSEFGEAMLDAIKLARTTDVPVYTQVDGHEPHLYHCPGEPLEEAIDRLATGI